MNSIRLGTRNRFFASCATDSKSKRGESSGLIPGIGIRMILIRRFRFEVLRLWQSL